ncbi:MAG TPA: enoyl-CoA hydratase/isomerase family protein [Pseudolabrys sp.]|nr:enoyl-CoA hydratase/isomerase family protein [Pseudolabrys sp.]
MAQGSTGAAATHPQSAAIADWTARPPSATRDLDRDTLTFSEFWQKGLALLGQVPGKDKRNEAEQALAQTILDASRRTRSVFLRAHAPALYRRLTADLTRHVRVEALAEAAAEHVPGLTPTKAQVAAERACLQKNKDGHEIDQGLLFNHFIGDKDCGLHLCHTMLLPRAEALAQRERLAREGRVDLGTASVERRGKASIVTMNNPRYLNAEDDNTLPGVETAIDLALLDSDTSVCVLRGSRIEGGKYNGQNVFSTGINLTHLYNGKISFLWYLIRDMGFVNKMFRGLALPDLPPDEIFGDTLEKLWIAVVEKFAIGGGCQYLLATDYVLAASDSYMTLPARKEGIIPGVANLRLTRFVGDRLARQLVMYERRLDCDSPEGRLVCDDVVDPEKIEQALTDVIDRLTTSGVVSAASNRRAFRIAQEPLDLFRSYMAVYSREQAACHFSPALISNLERYWNAQQRAA